MVEFNGAVLVDRNKIGIALDIYTMWYNANNRRMRDHRESARAIALDFSSFELWWHKNKKWEKDPFFGAFLNKYSHMFFGLADSYFNAGIICDKEHSILSGYTFGSSYDEIKAMYDCGEPIYLNPSQARFINNWYFELNH